MSDLVQASTDAEDKAPYVDTFLQYGDYVMEGVGQLPGSCLPEGVASRSAGAGAAAAAGGDAVQEQGPDEDLLEAFALAQLQLDMQGAVMEALGLSLHAAQGGF